MKPFCWRRACALLMLVTAACAGPANPTERVAVATRARFELVSGVLGARCGSLDCHGQVGRSLRIYSQLGLRLADNEFPGLEAGVVSESEVEANYRASVSLEPETMALVVRDEGRDPERLTLVRKARGSENHKGGAAIAAGSAADHCVLSWLASDVDDLACGEGALVTRPDAGLPP
jgi:hypothetical protein